MEKIFKPKGKHKKKLQILTFIFIGFILLTSTISPVFAEDKSLAELVVQVQETNNALTALSEEIYQLEQQVSSKNTAIENLKQENEKLKAVFSAQKAEMEERLRAMYMYDSDDAIAVLFSSESFSEFFTRAELVIAIYQSDQSQLNQLSEIQTQIQKNEEKMESELAALQESQTAAIEKEAELTEQIKEQRSELADAQVAAVQNGSGEGYSSASSYSSGNTTQTVSDDDFDLICAIVRHEGGASYEGSLAVISCVMNRVEVGGWYGSDAVSVLTKPWQFESYFDGYYKQFLGAEIPETRQAVRDCMEGGIRSHPYLSFRSAWYVAKYPDSFPTDGVNICGNYYFHSK